MTEQDQTVCERRDYYPFGERIDTSSGDARSEVNGYALTCGFDQRFTAKERDAESGLDYFLARYYSSSLGRFNSVDPSNAGVEPSDPQTWNGYAYVTNQPFRFVDPDGRERAQILLDQDNRELLAGKITREEFMARQKARGTGAAIGLAIVGGVAYGPALARAGLIFALSRPETTTQIAETGAELALGVEGPSPGSLALKTGDLVEQSFKTSKGTVDLLAEAVVDGKTLTLKDIAVFPRNAEKLNQGTKEVLSFLKKELGAKAKELDFTKLRIQGERVSGANPEAGRLHNRS